MGGRIDAQLNCPQNRILTMNTDKETALHADDDEGCQD